MVGQRIRSEYEVQVLVCMERFKYSTEMEGGEMEFAKTTSK